MKQFKKSKIAFDVFAASAIVTLGATAFSAAFAAEDSDTQIINVAVDESLTITIHDDAIDLFPSASVDNGLATSNGDVTVGTNNALGASLYIEMDSSMASNSLVGQTVSSNTIAPTASTTLGNNTWGYEAYAANSSATGTWSAVPVSGSPTEIYGSGVFGTPGELTYRFEYGTKVDFALPADTYSGTVLYTATTN